MLLFRREKKTVKDLKKKKKHLKHGHGLGRDYWYTVEIDD
jgi:hypothetical protein